MLTLGTQKAVGVFSLGESTTLHFSFFSRRYSAALEDPVHRHCRGPLRGERGFGEFAAKLSVFLRERGAKRSDCVG